MTSKLQVTIPKALAEQFGIEPGDDVQWESAGSAIRLSPDSAAEGSSTIAERVALFDEATKRQHRRQRKQPMRKARSRGWTREELYLRGRPR